MSNIHENTTSGLPAVHDGHHSAGSQIPTKDGQIVPIDLAAETAKFDNAYTAIPGAISPMAQSSLPGTTTTVIGGHSHVSHQGSHAGQSGELSQAEKKEEAKKVASEKKEEYKERRNNGEGIMDIAKSEMKDAEKKADEATPEGHKPTLMEKVKAKFTNP